MRNFKEKIITFFFIIFILVVFGFMGMFCLDIFGIIEIPEKYSIFYLFYPKQEVVVTAEVYGDNTNTTQYESSYFEEQKDSSIIVELDENTSTEMQITDYNRFYYDQLDEYAKKIYDKISENKEKLKTGKYVFEFNSEFNELLQHEDGAKTLNNSFQIAVNAFIFDNPEIFYIDISKMYLLTEITTKAFSKSYKVSIGPNEGSYLYDDFVHLEDLNTPLNQIEQIKNSIISNANGSNYEKVKYIHNYLINNLEYKKTESLGCYTIYGSLVNGRSVCEGYAKTFKYLLDSLEIPCIIVCGIGRDNYGQTESHAWNAVKIEGSWYAVDVTWDDPIIIGSGRITDDIRNRYFLKGSNTFNEDHLEEGSIIQGAVFTYPKLSTLDY